MVQAGTQLPPLLEGDEATPECDHSSTDTAVHTLSQVISSVDLGSGKTATHTLADQAVIAMHLHSVQIKTSRCFKNEWGERHRTRMWRQGMGPVHFHACIACVLCSCPKYLPL